MATVDHGCASCDQKGDLKRCARCSRTYYCSRDCQRKDWAKHKADCTTPLRPPDSLLPGFATTLMYEVKRIAGKGLGLVATRNIPKGARLISETAIFEIPRNSINPMAVQKSILECLEKVDDEKKKAFYGLHNAHGIEVGTALGIARTNALPFGSNATEGGLFLEASRINHSCCHNAQNTWNANLNQLTIHAFKDIKEGEEICISYLDGSEDYQTRQRELQARFCFTCTCELCSLSPSKRQRSDKRLNEITRLDEIIGDGMSIIRTPIACLYHAHRVLELLEEEQIEDARIPRLYYDAFQIAIANGDQARAKVFTERAYATRVILEGEDSPEVARLKGFVERPSSHRLYGTTWAWRQGTGKIPKNMTKSEFEGWLWKRRS